MPEDSSPVASVTRTQPDHTFAVLAFSDDLHGPRHTVTRYSICCLSLRVLLLHRLPSRQQRAENQRAQSD